MAFVCFFQEDVESLEVQVKYEKSRHHEIITEMDSMKEQLSEASRRNADLNEQLAIMKDMQVRLVGC